MENRSKITSGHLRYSTNSLYLSEELLDMIDKELDDVLEHLDNYAWWNYRQIDISINNRFSWKHFFLGVGNHTNPIDYSLIPDSFILLFPNSWKDWGYLSFYLEFKESREYIYMMILDYLQWKRLN